MPKGKNIVGRLAKGCTYQIVHKESGQKSLAQVDKRGRLLAKTKSIGTNTSIFNRNIKRSEYNVVRKIGS